MYKKGKLAPESLLITLEKMGNIQPVKGVYVGDAYSDYKCAGNTGLGFVYFCPLLNQKDKKISNCIEIIHNHKDILRYSITLLENIQS